MADKHAKCVCDRCVEKRKQEPEAGHASEDESIAESLEQAVDDAFGHIPESVEKSDAPSSVDLSTNEYFAAIFDEYEAKSENPLDFDLEPIEFTREELEEIHHETTAASVTEEQFDEVLTRLDDLEGGSVDTTPEEVMKAFEDAGVAKSGMSTSEWLEQVAETLADAPVDEAPESESTTERPEYDWEGESELLEGVKKLQTQLYEAGRIPNPPEHYDGGGDETETEAGDAESE